DTNGDDSNSGTSWSTPFKTLSHALEIVQDACDDSVNSILVAEGTYYPDGALDGSNREGTFLIARGGLELLGGYPSGGGERNPEAHPVYLDGNSNSYHIMVIAGLSTEAGDVKIDGFIFRNGMADGSGDYTYNGVGMGRNFAGGLITINNENNITISHNTFSNNTAGNGGGMVIYNSDTRVENCTFSGNNSFQDSSSFICGGGAIFVQGSAPVITGCLFENNTANKSGGAMLNNDNSSGLYQIENCTF